MTTTKRIRSNRVALGLVILMASTTACSAASTTATSDNLQAPERILFDGYPAQFDSPSDAVDYVDSPLVIEAVVTTRGSARWNGVNGERPSKAEIQATGRPEFIWVPIEIQVTRVLRGEHSEATVTLRSLGGQVDGVAVDFADMNPLPPLDPGTRLVIFMSSPTDIGDRVLASTPDFVYVVNGDTATASNGTHTVALAELVRLVEASND